MKIINYGPGYEPKTIICSTCTSKIEYIKADVQCHISKVKTKDNTCQISCLEHFECPVCNAWIELSRTLKNIPSVASEEPKKIKWFSRKEK